jgi:hypothetical protein
VSVGRASWPARGLLAPLSIALTLLLFSSCATHPPNSITVDPLLEPLVPPDAVFAAGLDVDTMRNSPAWQKHLSKVDFPALTDFTRKTGLDPRQDIHQLLFYSTGKATVLLVRGKEPKFQPDIAPRFDYKGFHLYGNERGAVLLLTPTTAAAGPTPALRTLIDQRDRGSHHLPPALAEKVRRISGADQIWGAFIGGFGDLDLGIDPNTNLGNILQIFKGIDSATFGIDLRTGFNLQAQADCRTERDAKRLKDTVKGVVGLGRLSTPDNRPELLKLYDAIQTTQDNQRVQVNAVLSADQVDQFLDLWLKSR